MNTSKYNDAKAVAINVNTEDHTTHEQEARDHMVSRLTSVYHEKQKDAEKKYYMVDEDFVPKNPKELVERIQKGEFKYDKYRVNEDGTWKDITEEEGRWYSPFNQIRWRTKDPDRDGYKKAMDKLRAAEQKAMDEITVLPLETGLSSLREFQEYTVQ